MPSQRETSSTSWRYASTVEWDLVRSAAGWGERVGRTGEAEALMARAHEALGQVRGESQLVADYLRARAGRARAHARARARVITESGRAR